MATSPSASTNSVTVKSRSGVSVAAKYLQDQSGNFVINPLTKVPYVVPADYDLAGTQKRYSEAAAIANAGALATGQASPACWRRLNIEPPCRFNIEPGWVANS